MKHLAICVPSGDDVRADFAGSLGAMRAEINRDPPPGFTSESYHNHRGSVLPMLRIRLVREALEAGATHILFIDSDMFFGRRMAHNLLARDREIVAINARMRRPPFVPCALRAPKDRLFTRADSTGLEQAYRFGFGVVLLSAKVFQKIPEPWFSLDWVEEEGEYRGEDYAFCERARAAGFELWIDHDESKRVAHVGTIGLTVGQEDEDA